MTQDAYWDELGLAWTAIRPDVQTIAPLLKQRLRRQAGFTTAILFAGLPLALAGGALGAWTIWLGASAGAWFFVTRGIAILTISALAGFAAWSFRGTLRDETRSLADMIGLALLRAERWLGAIRSAELSLGIAAVFGPAGYILRIQEGKPSSTPWSSGLILLAVLALVLVLLHGKAKEDVAKFRYLKQLLLEER
jgi:hypothetical protein